MDRPAGGDGARRVMEAVAALGDQAAPRGVQEVTGLAARTVTKHLGTLRAQGLIEGNERAPRLTPAGSAFVAERLLPAPSSGTWDEAISRIWPPGYAAFVRLLLDAVVSRRLFLGRPGHPGFLAFGPPHSYKTAMAEFVDAAFGLEENPSVVDVSVIAGGEVIGRRRGGGFAFDPSPLTRRPFVCFDELGHAAEPTQQAVRNYLHGRSRVPIEGSDVELLPVAMATFNPRPKAPLWPLPEATWRRCIRIDTGPLRGAAPIDMGARLGAWYSGPRPAPIDLSAVRAPWDRLDERAWAMFDGQAGLYQQTLTERGRVWHDRRTFELVVLGRAARLGLGPAEDLALIAVSVAVDLLAVAETVPGLVEPGWTLTLEALDRAQGAGHEITLAAYDELTQQREAAAEGVVQRRHASDLEAIEVVAFRAALCERLTGAAKPLRAPPSGAKPQAAALRTSLIHLRQRAGDAGGLARLKELDELAAPFIAKASEMGAQIESEKQRRARSISGQRRKLDELGKLAPRQAEERQEIKSALTAAAKITEGGAFDEELARLEERATVLVDHVHQERQAAEWTRNVEAAQQREVEGRDRRSRELDRLASRTRAKKGESVAGVLVTARVLETFTAERQIRAPQGNGITAAVALLMSPRTERVTCYRDAVSRTYWPEQLAEWGTPEVLAAIEAARP